MTCADCIHFIYGGHLCRCDVRPQHSPGFLNKACEKFIAGDSRKERTDYIAGLPPVVIKKKPERFSNKQAKKHMEEKNTTPVQEPAPQTKVCKRCGRELPLESFAHSHLCKDGYQTICRDCISASLKEAHATGKHPGRKGRKAEEPAPETNDNVEPVVKVVRTGDDCLKYANDADIVAELRRRGWEVKATKTTIVEL